ncbi:serine/threonine-protein kinase [Stackebrandtia nassauensis]|uniref:non-specific serine/threonine protein kinase n=1 Tax=Stackebrandtia nassauensis (strain DSM 44728 / CIP 108903 / NRRL B-16338 / NBRC 102104 / LLR-40K-21) TaxID=446470 RepID=D3Q7Y1_STANL|nr:serine/threonine-protein kinase [Stackebrandtia nassauensis]ADD40486.1 serine/threonine protein kinase [Stackebrandtia nassauensis DSM 44728]
MTFPPDAAATPEGQTAPRVAQPGVVIADRYELTAKVGDGGHGTVWRAHDRLLQRDVAVKEVTLPPYLPPDEREQLCDRTLREARAAASLSHASVVRVFDVVTEDGRPWIVMELLKARSLADIISADGPMPPRVVAKIGLSLVSALEAAHEAGIVHRDIKPGNVMISADGRCVLSDFGAAAASASGTGHTAPGMVLGSAHYIAPERAIGGPAEPPSDLFSLGVTLYAALEGRPPFDRGDTTATMHAVVHDPPEAPRNAGPLAPLLAGLLDKDPTQRFTVQHTRNTLTGLLSGPLSADGATGVLPTSGGPISGIPASPGGFPVSAPPTSPAPTSAMPASGAPLGPVSGGPTSGGPVSGAAAPGYPAGYAAATAEPYTPPVDPYYHQTGQPFPQPPKQQKKTGMLLGIGIGVVVLALLGTLGFMMFGGSGEEPPSDDSGDDSQQDAAFETELYKDPDGRFTVEIPKGWKAAQKSNPEQTFLDITDPDNGDRWVRLNVLNEADPKAAVTGGVEGLKSSDKFVSGTLETVESKPAKLGDLKAHQVEYTAERSSDGQKRHAMWLIASDGSTSYHVYLSVPQKTWKDSLPIFENAVKTYKIL